MPFVAVTCVVINLIRDVVGCRSSAITLIPSAASVAPVSVTSVRPTERILASAVERGDVAPRMRSADCVYVRR